MSPKQTMIDESKAVETKIPADILRDSLLAHLAGAYLAVSKRLERKTGCSATRGFILSALKRDDTLNQNKIATQLGFDRTVVHRVVKTMLKDGLVAERKAKTGRALLLHLTAKGEKYHETLVHHRRSADEQLRQAFTAEERAILMRQLESIAEMEF